MRWALAALLLTGCTRTVVAAPAGEPATMAAHRPWNTVSRSRPLLSPAPRLNWHALAVCESGDRPSTNTGNGYYGLYQFDLSTWRSVGGQGLPSKTTRQEQTLRAQLLYAQRGSEPWPVCGRLL